MTLCDGLEAIAWGPGSGSALSPTGEPAKTAGSPPDAGDVGQIARRLPAKWAR